MEQCASKMKHVDAGSASYGAGAGSAGTGGVGQSPAVAAQQLASLWCASSDLPEVFYPLPAQAGVLGGNWPMSAFPGYNSGNSSVNSLSMPPGLAESAAEHLQAFSNNPHVLYVNTCTPAQQAALVQQLQKHGFEVNLHGNVLYRYSGDDAYTALEHLLDAATADHPLALECGSAMHLAMVVALKNKLGQPQFNAWAKALGGIEIARTQAPPLPLEYVQYYRAAHDATEQELPTDLQVGDMLYIQGPADGFAYHPAVMSNGFNAMVVGQNENGEWLLAGFVDAASPTHGVWTYAQLRAALLNRYDTALSEQDCAYIMANPNERAHYSALSYGQVAQNLMLVDGQLYPPVATSIRGVLLCTRLQKENLYYPNGEPNTDMKPRTVPCLHLGSARGADALTEHEQSLVGAIFGLEYKHDLPHQRAVCRAVLEFVQTTQAKTHAVQQAISQGMVMDNPNTFGGLVLYGSPGTGKTRGCLAALLHLQRQGLQVWETRMEAEDSLLSNQDYEAITTHLAAKNHEAIFALVEGKYAQQWQGADVLFVDDCNRSIGALAWVTATVLHYAKQHGKQVLVTTNGDPAALFYQAFSFPVDAVVLQNIEGEDYRQAHAWYVQPGFVDDVAMKAGYEMPAAVVRRGATPAQQSLWRYLSALSARFGQHGLALYGGPGLGKTTVLEAYFKTLFPKHDQYQQKVLWLEAHTLQRFVGELSRNGQGGQGGQASLALVEYLKNQPFRYLILDDCNAPGYSSHYQRVLFDVLNAEEFVNNEGDAVRMVLVSNRSSWEDLVAACTQNVLNKGLNPRMQSRYHGRFYSENMVVGEDFRANQAPAAYWRAAAPPIADKLVNASSWKPTATYEPTPGVLVVKVGEGLKKYKCYKDAANRIDNQYTRRNGNKITKLPMPDSVQQTFDQNYQNSQALAQQACGAIADNRYHTVYLDFNGALELFREDGGSCMALAFLIDTLQQFLDVMVAKDGKANPLLPAKQETIKGRQFFVAGEDANKVRKILEKIVEGLDRKGEAGKYASRLARLQI